MFAKTKTLVQERCDVVLQASDSFERLLLHGLASFYHLQSHSVDVSSGRAVKMRKSSAVTTTQRPQPPHPKPAAPHPLEGLGLPTPEPVPTYASPNTVIAAEVEHDSSTLNDSHNDNLVTSTDHCSSNACDDSPNEAVAVSSDHIQACSSTDGEKVSSTSSVDPFADTAAEDLQRGTSSEKAAVGNGHQPCVVALPVFSLVDVLMVLADSKLGGTRFNQTVLEQHRLEHWPSSLAGA